MSTTGIQNYLSNVFRQVYTYDTTAALFTPRLELSNIDTYSGNSVSVFTAAIGDAACNVYVGSNAGNRYDFIQANRNVTAVGYGAGGGSSNVSNSVYIGYEAGSAASDASGVIAIGSKAIGGGTSNIFIGTGTGSVGNNNIFIGHSIAPGNVSNQIRIGLGNEIALAGNFTSKWVGLGGILNPVDANTKFDVSGNTRINGALGIFMPPGDRTLDVNGSFRVNNGSALLQLDGSVVRATGSGASMTVTNSGFSVLTAPFGTELIMNSAVFYASDGLASMTLSNGTFLAQDPSGGRLELSNGFTTSTGGFTSLRGSIAVGNTSNVSIGANTLKKGLVLIAVSSGTANFDGRTSFVLDPAAAIVANVASNKSTTTTVNFTANSINISNTTGGLLTYSYCVTYFPMP